MMPIGRSEKRREAGTLLLLALVPTILFGDIFFGNSTLYLRDIAPYHYPGKRVLREIVLGGEFPYWSPYISAGQPLAANPVHQVFYPPTWLILLPDFTTGFNLLALLHVYLAIFGMYALLRSMRLGRAAAAFGGLSFGMGGLILSMLNLFPLLYTAAWLPVTCLFTRRFLVHRRRADFAGAALSFAMQLLVGEPVTALQTGIILGAYAIHRGFGDGGRRSAARAVGFVGAISLTALLLSSVQTIPAIDHLRDSARGGGIGYGELTEWSTPPLRLAEPLFPAILGRWMLGQTSVFPSAELFGEHIQPLFLSVYAGLAVVVLALAGLLARMRGARLFGILALLSAALALGAHTPLFRLLYETGALRFIRFPEKFLVMGVFAAVVFSACALERLLMGDPRLRRAALAVAAVVSLGALAGAAAAWLPAYESLLRRLYRIGATENVYGMVALSQKEWLFAALRGALLFLLIRNVMHARRAVWLALFFAFVLIDLAPQVPEIAPRFPRSFLESEPPTVHRFPPNRAGFRIFPLADWIRAAHQAPPLGPLDDLRYWGLRNELMAQMPGTYELRTVIDGDIDVSDLRAEREFVASVLELMKKEGRPADWMDIVAAMSNAWFVGVYRKPPEIAAMGRGIRQEAVRFLEGTHYPRYYFATEMVTVRDRHEFVRALRSRRFSRQVAFVQQPAFVPAAGTVLAQHESANHAHLDVEARGRAFLVMSVTPHKYWRLTIDGHEVPAIVTNIGYQGVVVPPGRHVVEMRYLNPLVAAGAAVSAATLLALILMLRNGARPEGLRSSLFRCAPHAILPPPAMPLHEKKVIAVLPAYNAERTLQATYDDIPKDWVDEILLVDDCSRDRTVELSRQLGIRTVVHKKNRGYGGNQKTCYRTAMEEMGGEIMVMVHPDHQYDPTIIPELVKPLLRGDADAIFGSRMLGGRPIEGGMPKWKYFANLFLTMVENATFYVYLSEYHSGFRAYTKRFLETVNYDANSDDFVFDTEIIAQAVAKSLRIAEVPIRTRYFDEASQVGFWRGTRYGLAILKTMIFYKLHKKKIWSHPIFRDRPAGAAPTSVVA